MKEIIIHHEKNSYTYYPASKTGDFAPTTLKDSIFAFGNTAEVFLALNENGDRFLIKRYKEGYSAPEKFDKIATDIKVVFNRQNSNYVMNELYVGWDDSGRKCKVFEYRAGKVLERIKPEEESLFKIESRQKLAEVLQRYCSFLESLKIFHEAGYLHCDVKLENIFSFRLNETIISQPIDLDNVQSIENLIDDIKSEKLNSITIKFPTSVNYYSTEDIKTLCGLKDNETELRRCISILDTTAAVIMLNMMLFGNPDYTRIPEKDLKYLEQDEAMQSALSKFIVKGAVNEFTERFASVDEMREQMSDILKLVSDDLPKTIRNAKQLAIGQNNYIKYRKNIYRKNHDLKDTDVVYIYELYDEFFNTDILPYIQKEPFNSESSEKVTLADLLSESRDNYIITAEGGAGKTTSLFYAFLQNITNDSDELYIYLPLSKYSSDECFSVRDFISQNSGFSFENLLQNNPNKITLLLDAFDEINIIRKSDESKKKEFTERFLRDIQGLKNVRVIISSRMLTGEESKSNFKTAKFLPLEEEQIKSFLNLNEDSYEEICKNNSLQTLLKNPFMLNIYKKVKTDIDEEFQIHSAADLLDQYFWQMYKSKQKDSEYLELDMKQEFNDLMDFVAESALVQNIKSKRKQLECYSNIIDLYQDDNNWHIRFSHMLFKEYFEAKYLFKALLNDRCNIKNIDIEALEKDFSYQILIFVAQMFASPNIGDQEFDAKKYFEDLFEFVVNTVEKGETWHYIENLIIANLLRIITFFMNGNLNEFDFKEYFSKHEFLEFAFNNCSELEHIIFPKDLCSIGYRAFSGCSSLTSITIPKGVTSIGDWAFSCCDSLTSITIPKGVTSIGDLAFSCCNSLASIMIPDSVTSIEMSAFAVCSSLMSINVDENNSAYKSIDGNVYSKDEKILIQYAIGKKDTSFAIPKGVTSIGDWAFRDCSSLTSITIPKGVTSIEMSAFAVCSSLMCINVDENNLAYKSIDGNVYSKDGKTLILYAAGKIDTSFAIPKGVTSIGDRAFGGYNSLTSITIPKGVISIGDLAFSGCSSLTSIMIPDSVTSIEMSAFAICSSLMSINVDENNSDYKSIDGDLYSRDGNTLIRYAAGKIDTSFVIPKGVTSIGDWAFRDCSSLTSITIPKCVTSIGDSAFYKCSSLTSITIPGRVTSIGDLAFSCCNSLTSIMIPKGVKSIGLLAFSGCSSLTNVFYRGTMKDFDNIMILFGNEDFKSATKYFYSEEPPTEEGNYWHYVDGVETIW